MLNRLARITKYSLCSALLLACSGEISVPDDSGGGPSGTGGADGASDGNSDSGGSVNAVGGSNTGGNEGVGGGANSGGSSSGEMGSGGSSNNTSGGTSSGGSSSGGTSGDDPDVPSTPACAEASGWPSVQASAEQQLLVLVNQYRASGATCGGVSKPAVGALTMEPHLRCAARLHSQDMGERDYFSHTTWNPSGTVCTDNSGCTTGNSCGKKGEETTLRCGKGPGIRFDEAGVDTGTWGENIAAGNSTAAATMTQWMNSTGHCNNIMNGNFHTIGVGYASVSGSPYTSYWTQAFGD